MPLEDKGLENIFRLFLKSPEVGWYCKRESLGLKEGLVEKNKFCRILH